ncbi:MAG TPA: metalloregulator ArsR/SmtB family transcription factor [Gemmatimonadaceae bacterium]|nr:metalloregulator ArsR/SmtB family transcription factor [Gemmatimonadaceae bacterium]
MPRLAAFPVEVIVSPRFDLFYALHGLASGASSPLRPWRDHIAQRLPRDLGAQATRVAPVPIFWPLLADALQGTPGPLSFEEIISALAGIPAAELKAYIIGGIFHDRVSVQALLSGRRTVRQILKDDDHPAGELLTHFGLRPYVPRSPAAVAIDTLLSDADSYREELGLVLQRFWRYGFGADWQALEPDIRAGGARLKELSERNAFGDIATELRLPVTADDDVGAIRTRSGTRVGFDRIERCYLIPSAFNTMRWWAKYEGTRGRVTLYFPVWHGPEPANALGEDRLAEKPAPRPAARTRAGKIDAEEVFRALGDTTRYAIASILARKPTTSADLSRALNVSKPTITHHVQALRSAGLITERTDGGSSLLSLKRDTIDALSSAAVRDLFSSTGELQLLTTRKRRGGADRQ